MAGSNLKCATPIHGYFHGQETHLPLVHQNRPSSRSNAGTVSACVLLLDEFRAQQQPSVVNRAVPDVTQHLPSIKPRHSQKPIVRDTGTVGACPVCKRASVTIHSRMIVWYVSADQHSRWLPDCDTRASMLAPLLAATKRSTRPSMPSQGGSQTRNDPSASPGKKHPSNTPNVRIMYRPLCIDRGASSTVSCREIGRAFRQRGLQSLSDWHFDRTQHPVRDHMSDGWLHCSRFDGGMDSTDEANPGLSAPRPDL